MIRHSPLESFEADELRGIFRYRRQAFLPGTWKDFPSRVDMVLSFVAEELSMQRVHSSCLVPGSRQFQAVCGIHPAQVSRIRYNKKHSIPELWLYRLHEFSGIPLRELFLLAGKPLIHQHVNARKETK